MKIPNKQVNMRIIEYVSVVNAVRDLCINAASSLPSDVVDRINEAYDQEPFPRARYLISQIIENSKLSVSSGMPLCQDTGLAIYFISLGEGIRIEGGSLTDAVNEGTRRGYNEGYLRKSIVKDPLFSRTNTGDNTPAVIHIDPVPGDSLTITLLPKGGGCENMSYLGMLKPSDGREGVVKFVTDCVVRSGGNPCPPVVVGIGIGGTADKACYLAKKSLLRDIGSVHEDPCYAGLETEILENLNQSGIGPLGLGGKITALAVHIEHFPCHIASLPVAVSLNCHSARKASLIL
ncbi:fumarate hydratase subunit alpha [Chitinispirillum alkaliphilum]|nr:fumarate hydratase subunit alpha [Chitinispirillum alkaliphilum]